MREFCYDYQMTTVSKDAFLFGGKGDPLSNFAFCDIEVDCPFCSKTTVSKTIEHAFQAGKATTCEDWHLIMNLKGPSQARAKGKKILLRSDWDQGKPKTKEVLMLDLLQKKFAKEPFRQMLLDIKQPVLIENAPWDGYWGAGKNGKGLNMLGRLMMMVRADLLEKPIELPAQTEFVVR